MFATLPLKPTRSILFTLLFFGIALVKGCEPVPNEYKAFFALDSDRQREEAKKFPIEKQIDYYLAGKKYVHPPSSILLYVIAEQGKSTVPALLIRMKNEESDSAKVHLLEVVRNIHAFHDDLRDETEVIEQLRVVVSEIKDAARTARAEAMLNDIIENRRPDN